MNWIPRAAFVLLFLALLALRGPALLSRAWANLAGISISDIDTTPKEKRAAEARPSLQAAVLADPGNQRAWWYLGYINHIAGRPEAATEAWRRSPSAFHELIRRGKASGTRMNDWESARVWFSYAARLDPDSAEAANALGDAWAALGNWEQARLAYGRALSLNPARAEHYTDYAQALMVDQHDLDLAEQLLAQAVALEPENELTYRGLATLADARGDIQKSIHWWQMAAKTSPVGSVDSLLHLAGAYDQAGQDSQALTALQRALQEAPDSPWTHLALASAHFQAARWSAAETEALQATVLGPGHVEAWILLGNARLRQGETGAARQAFEKVLEIDPDNDEAARSLNLLYSP